MRDGLTYKKVVVAFDGSHDGEKAIEAACSLAKQFGSEVVVAHAYSMPALTYAGLPGMQPTNFPDIEELSKQQGRKVLADGVRIAKECGTTARGELLESTSTVEALVEFAKEEKADLIVVGTRGMTGFKKLVMGSVSSGIVSHATCHVLVVR